MMCYGILLYEVIHSFTASEKITTCLAGNMSYIHNIFFESKQFNCLSTVYFYKFPEGVRTGPASATVK
jgi:hypothetical protein